jgi:hypothetical protein
VEKLNNLQLEEAIQKLDSLRPGKNISSSCIKNGKLTIFGELLMELHRRRESDMARSKLEALTEQAGYQGEEPIH